MIPVLALLSRTRFVYFFFSSRRRHTRFDCDWSSDVCSSDLVAEGAGYSVVRELVGHGIGSSFHEDPQVPNYGKPRRGPRLVPGMTIAIEPMVNVGGADIRTLDDKWTVVTEDGSLSAHFEHTVAILENGGAAPAGPTPAQRAPPRPPPHRPARPPKPPPGAPPRPQQHPDTAP